MVCLIACDDGWLCCPSAPGLCAASSCGCPLRQWWSVGLISDAQEEFSRTLDCGYAGSYTSSLIRLFYSNAFFLFRQDSLWVRLGALFFDSSTGHYARQDTGMWGSQWKKRNTYGHCTIYSLEKNIENRVERRRERFSLPFLTDWWFISR